VNKKIYSQLSLMMFLEFFVWGAWFVTVGNYMSTINMSNVIYWAYTVGPIGAIVSPFFLGMIADRFFATEKVLGILHLIGGVAIFTVPLVAEGGNGNATLFILLLLLHTLCYMPTIALVNSLAFHHITDQEKYFPWIRVFGTIGWIVAGLVVSGLLHADETALPLHIAGIAGVVMGFYSFTLPHTPPPAAGQPASVKNILGYDAFNQLKSKPFFVFLFSSLLICIPLSAYYAYAPVFVNNSNVENPAAWMTFGQASETIFMFLMPLFFSFLGVKWMLVSGMFAWGLRYVFFALAAPSGIFWMILGGIILHGICYDFFFVSGQIYVDKKSTPAIRGQAQGLLATATYGWGMLIGAQVSGWLFNGIVKGTGAELMKQWQIFWFIPAILSVLVMLIFAVSFKERVQQKIAK
jgi:nucleoside transporter